MASTRTLLQRVEMTTTTQVVLLPFPDVPGQVVEVRRLLWQLSSFSAATAVVVVLHHNIEVAITLSTADFTAAWARIDQGASNGGPAPVEVRFEPPYDLVGKQRMDFGLSSGTAVGILTVHYTTRRESNRTVWNELRSRTSFERG